VAFEARDELSDTSRGSVTMTGDRGGDDQEGLAACRVIAMTSKRGLIEDEKRLAAGRGVAMTSKGGLIEDE
jgi:hypothetical protein